MCQRAPDSLQRGDCSAAVAYFAAYAEMISRRRAQPEQAIRSSAMEDVEPFPRIARPCHRDYRSARHTDICDLQNGMGQPVQHENPQRACAGALRARAICLPRSSASKPPAGLWDERSRPPASPARSSQPFRRSSSTSAKAS